MEVINQYCEILAIPKYEDALKLIEQAGKTCYKSENNLFDKDRAEAFIKMIIKSGHESVIEHIGATVKFVTDRGILAEITRHRLASFSVESTRYANYSKDKFGNKIIVVLPVGFDSRLVDIWNYDSSEIVCLPFDLRDDIYKTYQYSWIIAMMKAEQRYFEMLKRGAKAELARSVLPNSLKTEIIMTCNVREWKHIFKLRCSPKAHPQFRALITDLLKQMYCSLPVFFCEEYQAFCKEEK